MSGDIATRVAKGVKALAIPGDRQAWQAQHNASLLRDAQTYDDLADALEADIKGRPAPGEKPWSTRLRAKRRGKPLRKAARAMRTAAKAVHGTAAAYEQTSTEKAAADRQAKLQAKGQVAAAPMNAAAQHLERLAPAASDGGRAGAPKVLTDFFPDRQKGVG